MSRDIQTVYREKEVVVGLGDVSVSNVQNGVTIFSAFLCMLLFKILHLTNGRIFFSFISLKCCLLH